jgi:hypothetical protein
MADRPKIKFTGNNKTINFEKFMEGMEKAMDQEGVTDNLRVREIEEWFGGEALEVVHMVKQSGSKEESGLVLQKIKDELCMYFGTEVFKAGERLKELMRGGPIARGDYSKIRAFCIRLQGLYFAADSRDHTTMFGSNGTYVEVLKAKMPHLTAKWTKEFEDDKRGKEVSFPAFKEFVLRVSKLDDKILGNASSSEGNSIIPQRSVSFGSPVPRNKSMLYSPFASGHPDASANGGNNQF